MNADPNHDRDVRRTICKAAIGGLTACSAGAVGFPIVTFLGFPKRLTTERPLEVPLDQLAKGQAVYAEFRGRQVIVVVLEDGARVFDAACTHLGCNVIWEAAERLFRCPCHGAVFGADGAVVRGPVNVPLRTLPFDVANGVLTVT